MIIIRIKFVIYPLIMRILASVENACAEIYIFIAEDMFREQKRLEKDF